MPFYIIHYNTFICDNCKEKADFILGKAVEVRKHGWAISKDYRKCYCPKCAPAFKSKGCCGRTQYKRIK